MATSHSKRRQHRASAGQRLRAAVRGTDDRGGESLARRTRRHEKIWMETERRCPEQVLRLNGDLHDSEMVRVVRRFHTFADAHGLPYCVVGGMAVVRNGYPQLKAAVHLSKLKTNGENVAHTSGRAGKRAEAPERPGRTPASYAGFLRQNCRNATRSPSPSFSILSCAKPSMASEMSSASTLPRGPTASASPTVPRPVPHAASSTRSPGQCPSDVRPLRDVSPRILPRRRSVRHASGSSPARPVRRGLLPTRSRQVE